MFDDFRTLEELEAGTRKLLEGGAHSVTVTRVGESWAGRPIEMISIGEGKDNALIVAVPHPNEPVGAVTVERMMALMLGPGGERERRGLRWNFIKAIDPEGLRLNQGWLKKPRTLESYFTHFFRPAADRQPDMTFPVELKGSRFEASTPENQAWQKAFELTQPKLHASVHNCDYGGALHLMSRLQPDLIPTLEQITTGYGLTPLDSLEQVGLPLEFIGRGVARYPSVPEIVAAEPNAKPAEVWPFGEMSPGYAEARFGTFTIISEVPLWDDVRLRDESASVFTPRDQLAETQQSLIELREFFNRHLEPLIPMVSSPDGEQLLAAVRETATWVSRSIDYFAMRERSADTTTHMPVREYLQKAALYALAVARGYAMVARIAGFALEEGGGRNPIAQAAQAEGIARVRKVTSALDSDRTVRPVPLATLTGIQMDAILASADVLTGSHAERTRFVQEPSYRRAAG